MNDGQVVAQGVVNLASHAVTLVRGACIIDVLGVSAMSVKYAATTTATNVR